VFLQATRRQVAPSYVREPGKDVSLGVVTFLVYEIFARACGVRDSDVTIRFIAWNSVWPADRAMAGRSQRGYAILAVYGHAF
jgi:hypothetical protein